METGANDITLLLRCWNLPAGCGLRLGIQKGKEVIDDVPPETPEVTFTVPLRLKASLPAGAGFDFAGPFVQGKKGERFLYLCWGEQRVGEAWENVRRAKLPLRYVTEYRVDAAQRSGSPIRVAIDMTGARGDPLCATIPEDYLTW